jgi:2-phospho-L-lactate guanylyltransferase
MTGIVAIVPVKPFDEGKSRLAGLLSPDERRALNRSFLQRTLDLAAEFPGVASTFVVSRSEEVLAAAGRCGMTALREAAGGDLNAALAQATRHARQQGASGVLILPTDIPLVDAAVIRGIVADVKPPTVIVVPDRSGQGTNLLFQTPLLLEHYCFGPESLQAHRDAAARLGIPIAVRNHPAVALDIDTPDDFRQWQQAMAEAKPMEHDSIKLNRIMLS